MSTITHIVSSTDQVKNGPATINTNFDNLNTDKLETVINAVGTDGQIAKAKSGTGVALKTIKAGSNVTVTNNTNDITIDVSAPNPDASSSTKGITKLSVDPVSPTAPIAVGDNDPRMTLATTSGSAYNSSSNKAVDNADTGTSGNNKVLRLDSSGKLPALDGSQLTNLPFRGLFKVGATTHDISTTGAQTIAHGLGVTPKFIRITARMLLGGTSFAESDGIYNGTTNADAWLCTDSGATSSGNGTGEVAHIETIGSGTNENNHAVATFDATNITLTWSKSGSPTGTALIMWEAFA